MSSIDFIGTIVLTAVIVVNVNGVISAMPIARAERLLAALLVGGWVGLQVALASAGAYADGAPTIGLSVAFPLAAVAITAYFSPRFREALLAAPTALLVGLNTARVLGVFFLVLAVSGRLGGPFPQSAGWGDIVVGVLAAPLAFAIARGRVGRGATDAWNLFGALDLIAAVSLGVLSAPGSPLQLIDVGAGSGAVGALPWSLIPTVLVPFYLISHAVIFAQCRGAVLERPQAAAAG
jgi:hypothetical protein